VCAVISVLSVNILLYLPWHQPRCLFTKSLFAFRSCKLLYVGGLQEQGVCSRNFVVVNFNLQEQGTCSQNVVVVNSDLQEQGTCSQTYLVS